MNYLRAERNLDAIGQILSCVKSTPSNCKDFSHEENLKCQ